MEKLKADYKAALNKKDTKQLIATFQGLRAFVAFSAPRPQSSSSSSRRNRNHPQQPATLTLDQLWKLYIYPIISQFRSYAAPSQSVDFNAFLLECAGYFHSLLVPDGGGEAGVVNELIYLYLGDLSRYLKNYHASIALYQQSLRYSATSKGQTFNQLAVVYQQLRSNHLSFLFYLRSFLPGSTDPFPVGRENFLKFYPFDQQHQLIGSFVKDIALRTVSAAELDAFLNGQVLHFASLISIFGIWASVNPGIIVLLRPTLIWILTNKSVDTKSKNDEQLIKFSLLFVALHHKAMFDDERLVAVLRAFIATIDVSVQLESPEILLDEADSFTVHGYVPFFNGRFRYSYHSSILFVDSLRSIVRHISFPATKPQPAEMTPPNAKKVAITSDEDMTNFMQTGQLPLVSPITPQGGRNMDMEQDEDDVVVFTGRKNLTPAHLPSAAASGASLVAQAAVAKAPGSPAPIGFERGTHKEAENSPFMNYLSGGDGNRFGTEQAAIMPSLGSFQNSGIATAFPTSGSSIFASSKAPLSHQQGNGAAIFQAHQQAQPGTIQSLNAAAVHMIGNQISFMPPMSSLSSFPASAPLNSGFAGLPGVGLPGMIGGGSASSVNGLGQSAFKSTHPFSWLMNTDSYQGDDMPFKLT